MARLWAAPRLASAEVAHRPQLIIEHFARVALGAQGSSLSWCPSLCWASLAREAVLEAPAGERHPIAESPRDGAAVHAGAAQVFARGCAKHFHRPALGARCLARRRPRAFAACTICLCFVRHACLLSEPGCRRLVWGGGRDSAGKV